MAKFNPDNGSGDPTNFTGRSQGLPANRAGEIFAEGAAGVLEGAARTKDFTIQQDIRQDVDDIFMATNAGFGVDEKTGFDAVQNKEMVPDEFKGTADTFRSNLDRLQAAREQGAMTDTHYYSMLAHAMKNIKSKYPGYHEVVDNIFGDVTGVRPANAVHNAIRQEQEAELKKMDDAGKDQKKFLMDNAEYWGRKYSWDEVMSGQVPFDEIASTVVRYKAEIQAVRAENANLDLKKAQGADVKEDKLKVFARDVATTVRQGLDGTSSRIGFDLKATTSKLLDLKNQANPPPEQVHALVNTIQAGKLAVEQELRAKFMKEYPDVDPTEAEKIIQQNLKIYQDIADHAGAGNFELAGQAARLLEMNDTYNVKSVLANNPKAEELRAMEKIHPQLAQDYLTRMAGKGEIVETYGPHYLKLGSTGMMSVYDIMMEINQNESIPEDQRNRLASEVISSIDSAMMNPNQPDEYVLKFMETNFGGEVPPMAKVIELINRDGGGARSFFMNMSKPGIIDRLKGIKGEKGTEAVKRYGSFIVNMVDDIPEVERLIADTAVSAEYDPQRMINLRYDQSTGSFIKEPNPDFPANTDPMVSTSMLGVAQKELDKVNSVMKNLRYTLKAAGIDPEVYINNYLRMKGVYVDPKQGGGKATNPLDSTGAEDLSDLRLPVDGFQFASLVQQQADDYLTATTEENEENDGDEDIEMIPVIDAPKPPSFVAYAAAQDDVGDAFKGVDMGTPGLRFTKEWQSTGMVPEFKASLQKVSEEMGFPLVINSGHRPSAYNRKIKGARGSRHVVGDAADISMRGMSTEQRKLLVKTLMKNGVHRFITYSRSPDMIHVDADKRFGKAYFMHDKSKSNLRNAPAWMKELNDELAMSDTDGRLDALAKEYGIA